MIIVAAIAGFSAGWYLPNVERVIRKAWRRR